MQTLYILNVWEIYSWQWSLSSSDYEFNCTNISSTIQISIRKIYAYYFTPSPLDFSVHQSVLLLCFLDLARDNIPISVINIVIIMSYIITCICSKCVIMLLFPPASAVEGINSVRCVCLSVCLSVSQRSQGWTDWATDPKFGVGIDLDNISEEFEGQGHRSKVKVANLKNVIFGLFLWCDLCRLHRAIL